MKKLICGVILILIIVIGIGTSGAVVGLPTANFTGNAQTTATIGLNPGSLTLVSAFISKINYDIGSCSVSIPCGEDETMLNSEVVILGADRTGSTTFTNAVFEVRDVNDTTFKYLTATLSNIMFVPFGLEWYLNPGLDINDLSTLNLTNVVLRTDENHPSKYIQQLQNKLGTNNSIGMMMSLANFSGNLSGDSTSNVSVGLIDGTPIVPSVEPPSGARSIGFWKNHDEERNAFIAAAVSKSNVFVSESDLNIALARKGSKSMQLKAEQQLAGLMLNVASSLPLNTTLSDGEFEILQSVNPGAVAPASVEDALSAIENAIFTGINLEAAKDLADEINNRDHKS